MIRIKTRTGKKDRVRTYPIDEVLPYFRVGYNENPFKRSYSGYEIYMKSLKYSVYYLKEPKCICCGLEGTYFALERHCNLSKIKKGKRNGLHFNLYGINGNGEEIPLTVDHIRPQYKNGGNSLKNIQILCANCNNKKGHKRWSIINYLWVKATMRKLNSLNLTWFDKFVCLLDLLMKMLFKIRVVRILRFKVGRDIKEKFEKVFESS